MVKQLAEDKTRKRIRQALEEGKEPKARGEVNKRILEEVRAEVAAAGRQQQKVVQQTGYRAVKRVEQAGDKECEKMHEYARAKIYPEMKAMAAVAVKEAQSAPASTDAAATAAPEPAAPVAPEPAPEPVGAPVVLGSEAPCSVTTLALQTSELDLEDEEWEDMEASRSALKERCAVLVKAKDAEAARIKPQLEKDVGEIFDRLSKEHEWPANEQFRKQILFRVERFFVKNPFLKDLQERLAQAEASPHLSRKRKACFDCRPLDPFDYTSPIMPCGAHSALTGEQHAEFEAKLRTEWAERAILQAADGLRDTLMGQAEQDAKRKKWMAAETAKEQQADHDFEAECKAKRMLFATTRRCAECKAAVWGEPCERHQTELEKLRDELLQETCAVVR